jgi:fructose-specific phosphotransferase system IIC component
MRTRDIGTFVAGVVLAGAVVGGAVAIDTSGPTKSAGWSDPVPCVEAAGGELVCGSPIASPVPPTIAVPTATATAEPTVTAEPTIFIDTLPATGTGSSR